MDTNNASTGCLIVAHLPTKGALIDPGGKGAIEVDRLVLPPLLPVLDRDSILCLKEHLLTSGVYKRPEGVLVLLLLFVLSYYGLYFSLSVL